MSKELTYILGAGASFQSIPVVKSFSSRFNEFTNFLRTSSNSVNIRMETKDAVFKEAFEATYELYKAFKSHQSFDTYFKKLFHTGQTDQIIKGKKILNLYFIWEHLSNISKEPSIRQSNIFWKQATIDKRYDALIASLLKPIIGKRETYCPINFISWNYDLNLLVALKNYFSPETTIGEFHSQIKVSENIWKIGDTITVLNMNGYFFCNQFEDIHTILEKDYKIENIQHFIYQNISTIELLNNSKDPNSELIKFAWESISNSGSNKTDFLAEAKEKILKSNNIVVIGYTFPLYNRLIDYEYFNRSSLLNKNIFVQDPNASEIKAALISDFDLSEDYSPSPSLKEISNCDSFFVPSNIFKYKDSMEML